MNIEIRKKEGLERALHRERGKIALRWLFFWREKGERMRYISFSLHLPFDPKGTLT